MPLNHLDLDEDSAHPHILEQSCFDEKQSAKLMVLRPRPAAGPWEMEDRQERPKRPSSLSWIF